MAPLLVEVKSAGEEGLGEVENKPPPTPPWPSRSPPKEGDLAAAQDYQLKPSVLVIICICVIIIFILV